MEEQMDFDNLLDNLLVFNDQDHYQDAVVDDDDGFFDGIILPAAADDFPPVEDVGVPKSWSSSSDLSDEDDLVKQNQNSTPFVVVYDKQQQKEVNNGFFDDIILPAAADDDFPLVEDVGLPISSSSSSSDNHPMQINNEGLGQSPLEDIEKFLFNDDQDLHLLNGVDETRFFNDILLADSPPPIPNLPSPSSCESVASLFVVVDDNQQQQKEDDEDHSHDDDQLTKKRKRQLRNKDAALRSRERKKSYVKELEMKSSYYEQECRRLSSVLQCFMAENQALRFSLHSSNLTSNTTSINKQESAVLFLESLLLGSLLWLMAVVCQLLVLPSQLAEENVVEEKLLPSPVLRKGPSKASMKILMVGKRFKASRSRMRTDIDSPSKVVNNLLLAVF